MLAGEVFEDFADVGVAVAGSLEEGDVGQSADVLFAALPQQMERAVDL